MTRTLARQTLVIASHNPGKLREIDDLIRPFGVNAISAADLKLNEPEETELSFAGNARLKAEHAAQASRHPALSDDSGLCIDALNGGPGVFSARWAGPNKDFRIAMELVHEKLLASNLADRRAHFVCALALAWPDGKTEIFEGRVDGKIIWPPRGDKGFGYDPIFVPDGYHETFGEMDPVKKHAISHRARAFQKFVETCLATT